jgi:uncharacterized protein with HEPN domain
MEANRPKEEKRIVHDYFDIDVEIIWYILKKDIPLFKQNLLPIRPNKT